MSTVAQTPRGALTCSGRERCSTAGNVTRSLLGYLALAGLFYVIVSPAQAVARRFADVGTEAPRLLAGYGLGLIGAGVFRADAADGFPPGTPARPAAHLSGHGVMRLRSALLAWSPTASSSHAALTVAHAAEAPSRPAWSGWCSRLGSPGSRPAPPVRQSTSVSPPR